MWEYNIASNTWIHWNGKLNQIGVVGYYEERGVPSPLNRPGSRWGHAMWASIDEKESTLWLFGGWAMGVTQLRGIQ